MRRELLIKSALELGIELSDREVDSFELYMRELLAWNEKMNLTAITKGDEIVLKHFIDSLLPLKAYSFEEHSIIDIGAGAGFPGIPLKIVRPGIQLTLVDSVEKKTGFLEYIVASLNLDLVDVLCGRAEDLAHHPNEHGKQMREKFDMALSRAVAPLNVLAEYCLPFVKVGGAMIALKGENVQEEAEKARNAIKLLGGKLAELAKVKLPSTDIIRTIVIIEKIERTPAKYPRRPGIPKKTPL